MASGIEQRLIQRLVDVKAQMVVQATRLPADGQDLKFEFGRRVGYIQGIDFLTAQVMAFFADDGKDDESL